jgi:hypothetical protein
MNAKHTIPLISTAAPLAALAPPLLLIAGIGLTLYWLLSEEEEKKPDLPTNAEGGKTPIGAPASACTASTQAPVAAPSPKPLPAPVPLPPTQPLFAVFQSAIASSPAVDSTPKVCTIPQSLAVAQPTAVSPVAPSPRHGQPLAREGVARIFNCGARALTRKAAVDALKSLGFGKSAAYEALSPDGRFAAWLYCSPDGTLTWKG